LQAVNDAKGTLLFTLVVFTSDDVFFKTALTPSLKGGAVEKKITDTYQRASADREEKPALIFAFAPFLLENSGDEYVRVLSEASGNVPCFGTLAVDDTSDFRECYMLFNEGHYKDKMALILVYGNITPQFYLASISKNKLLDRSALVTASEGHILKEVNGRPVVEYFENMGLTKASETSYAMTSLPFMLDYGDGTPPVSRVFVGLNEQKQAICAGAMPEGSTLYIGVFDKEDVLLTTGNTFKKALEETASPSVVIGYSCISRSMTLGSDVFAEIDLVMEKIAKKTPVFFAYSGGEICPTQINSQVAINRFHNNTFILCVF
jgi:hypothetical protein